MGSKDAISVSVELASVLTVATNDVSRLRVSGATLQEALDDVVVRYPGLAVHLYDESGQVRPHVLIFVNEERLPYRRGDHVPLHKGDRVTVLQAVSGG